MDNERRAFVSKLAEENREFYGSPDGRGILRAFELAFENQWVYLFELAQNALDAGAHSIAIRLAEGLDVLTFQHDGDQPLDERDVEGLSKVFRSTKGASSVGFMGIGFKSVFGRFQEACVSGCGWRFLYETTQVVGEEYGDVQRDLLGAVVPVWDDAIPAPEPGFTTRFEMHRPTVEGRDLQSDLAHFLPEGSRTILAILAASGLERLEVNDQVWELSTSEEPGGRLVATACTHDESRLWQLFRAQFRPSREAVACFLEHRRIQPSEEEREQVYADAARDRWVWGVLPLDNDGMPKPAPRGQVWATLPTEVSLPFGLHINADWLLNISRTGLREIEDNPWQRGIADSIGDILACFLEWSADTLAEPDGAKAAFKALALPSPEAGGLEALLASGQWLSRLRSYLEDAAVVPVWAGETGALAFRKPGHTVVPPAPLARAFSKSPELRPAVLLRGPVLMENVLGPDALRFLRGIGLLGEMSPQELGRAWQGGLEDWWRQFPGEHESRRRLLLRLWAAVADLSSDDVWRDVDLHCIRSVAGKWHPVTEVVFLNERLPTKREPGGSEVRGFVEPFVPDESRLGDEWVATLRERRRNELEETILSQAWEWIERHARGISLQEVVEAAVNNLMSSASPDWSVLVPLGHWSKHRNRPDLLTHVLVESESGQGGLPVGEALLATAYVEYGRDLALLFPASPAISAAYLEQDPKHASSREWRAFFREAGAKGEIEVRTLKDYAYRGNRRRVAGFLGLELAAIGESNNSGYQLLDFDIEPSLPSPDAAIELRETLAAWIKDGSQVLHARGLRQCTYFYYTSSTLNGTARSAWVIKLSELAWVPCEDGELRRPQDALPATDPAREDAPVAQLSSELLSVLEKEGVKFGTAIPEATSLRRLAAVGSRLDARELAELLSQCRDEVTSDTDRGLLDRALQELTVPSIDNLRFPLDRIVRRVGGSHRGGLGGRVVPLDRIAEVLRGELEHPDLPRDFPDTTSGHQALDYIRDVWKRARSSPEGLANEVRDVLPTAYAYCLEDCTRDSALSERWEASAKGAVVFAEREWVVLTEADNTYFDDIEDRRFLPTQHQVRIVTGGHLGHSRSQQLSTAEAIGLPLLSSSVSMEWHWEEGTPLSDDWVSRFDLTCQLLQRVRGGEREESDGAGFETEELPRLIRVRELALDVRVLNGDTEHVPVNARLHERTLAVAGLPIQFGADAAKELLREYSFGQRADLAADLTGMLTAIDAEQDFCLAADKFRRSHAPKFELPPAFRVDRDHEEATGPGRERTRPRSTDAPAGEERPGAIAPTDQAPSSGASERGKSNLHDDGKAVDDHRAQPGELELEEYGSTGGSYTRDRALARQNALAEQLRSSLKGEVTPNPEKEDAGETGISNDRPTALGDEEYREIAARYEKEAGREPELGDPRQAGWDIRSTDPRTKEVRLIEVKGRGRPWEEDEVVELTRAQVGKAFETADKQATDSWYLYVVEKTDDGGYQVLPIANPVRAAAKWILLGKAWRMVAESPKSVAGPKNCPGGFI